MSRSEFRWNKKRRHYAYLFKDKGECRKNILLHSNPEEKEEWKTLSIDNKKVFSKRTRVYLDTPTPTSLQIKNTLLKIGSM